MKPAPNLPSNPRVPSVAKSRWRLLWSFYAASFATHAVALAALIMLLRPAVIPPKFGELAPLDVQLVAETPFETITLVHADTPLELLPVLPLLPPPLPMPPMRELSRVEGDVQSVTAEAAPAYDPRPIDVQGRIAVGPVDDLTRLSPSDAARIKQAYAPAVHRAPQLGASLSVAYPNAALRSHTEGRVLVLVFLDAEGKISEAKAIPDQSTFGVAALAALKGARFLPATTNEKPHPYWAMLEFVFTIAGEVPVTDAAKR